MQMDSRDRAKIDKLLPSKRRHSWLEEVIFECGDVSYTREEIVELTLSPSTRAAYKLSRMLKRFGIHSILQLNNLGLDALARIQGVGETAQWIAAYILYEQGYDVEVWIARKNRKGASWGAAIRDANRRALKRQKHA